MKYTYAYKESNGTRHEATMVAASRDEVFRELRKQGIRAIKVVAADGSKANGEIRGVRKRIVALVVVLTAVAAGLAVYFVGRVAGNGDPETVMTAQGPVSVVTAMPLSRRAITGDRMRVEAAGEIFKLKAEAFLARFAEPGRAFSAPESDWPSKADFDAAFKTSVKYAENEYTEQIDLKRIVVGMKQEMLQYLRGGGLVSGYIRELIKRQKMEISYREKAEGHLKEMLGKFNDGGAKNAKGIYEYWLKANAQLQSMGIYTIAIPDELRNYQLSVDLNE